MARKPYYKTVKLDDGYYIMKNGVIPLGLRTPMKKHEAESFVERHNADKRKMKKVC